MTANAMDKKGTTGVVLLCFCLCLPAYCSYQQQIVKDSDNYGPYIMDWDSYVLCKGPKAVNLTSETFYLDRETGYCVFNITFINEARIDEVKVVVYTETNGVKNVLWNYRIKDPCQHFMVATLIKQELAADNCVVKKGFYSCRVNFHEASKMLLGANFFYGKFTFKTVMLSKKGNIHCFETVTTFTKRN